MGHDIIGDVHGDADRLEALLRALGYAERGGAWRHPSRAAIFVGDLIDRGPGQLRTLELVRAMVEAGAARVVMGNHEFNAIAWASPDTAEPGAFLRPRHGRKGEKNRRQHQAFLGEVGADSAAHAAWIAWFLELPLWIEAADFQVVHACWSPRHMAMLRPHLRSGQRLERGTIDAAARKNGALYEAVEVLLKGMEVPLPPGVTFTDKDGHVRDTIRTRWWDPDLTTYRAAYIGPRADIPDLPIVDFEPIPPPEKPTFIGHYWFDPRETPRPASHRVACVDYSLANGGPLVAYRFDGEPVLSDDRFVAM